VWHAGEAGPVKVCGFTKAAFLSDLLIGRAQKIPAQLFYRAVLKTKGIKMNIKSL
jgi:hypothetical protein